MHTSIGTQHALSVFTELSTRLGISPELSGLYARARLSDALRREAFIQALNDCFATVLTLAICCVGLVLIMRMVRRSRAS